MQSVSSEWLFSTLPISTSMYDWFIGRKSNGEDTDHAMSHVVFGAANHWTSPYQVGSHAWARLFSKNRWKVTYLSDPITPWHWVGNANRDRLSERYRLWKTGGESFENNTMNAWVPLSLLAPQNQPGFRSNWVLRNWYRFCIPSIGSFIERSRATNPDVVWLDSIRHYDWAKSVGAKYTVLRLADWTAGFSGTPPSILDLEKQLIEKVDLVVTTATSLSERFKSLRRGKPMVVIPNGVDTSFWNEKSSPPPEYAQIPTPRVIYVGALDEWFDFDLLFKMVNTCTPSCTGKYICCSTGYC